MRCALPARSPWDELDDPVWFLSLLPRGWLSPFHHLPWSPPPPPDCSHAPRRDWLVLMTPGVLQLAIGCPCAPASVQIVHGSLMGRAWTVTAAPQNPPTRETQKDITDFSVSKLCHNTAAVQGQKAFQFSATWSCVSLPRSTTSSDRKLVAYLKSMQLLLVVFTGEIY